MLVLNVVFGFILTAYTPFKLCFTSAAIIVTAVLICLLSTVRLKDAFAISLSFLFAFLGVVEFILGCCSPETFTDNGCFVSALALLAFEVAIFLICSLTSKKNAIMCNYGNELMSTEAIIESFKNNGVHSGINKIIGEWAISNDGDIMCLCNEASCYTIFSEQLSQMPDWREHLNSKEWFKDGLPTISENFQKAMDIARFIQDTKQ